MLTDEELGAGSFVRPVAAIAGYLIDLLDERLAGTAIAIGAERDVLFRTARRSLVQSMQVKLNRVLLLELHAASIAGQLTAPDDQGRWSQFLDLAADPAFPGHLAKRYPTLPHRIDTAGRYFIDAVCSMTDRLAADRDALDELNRAPLGGLRSLVLDAGDPHRRGQTVARLDFDGGTVMYKPRPVDVEAALDRVLAVLVPEPERLKTPPALVRDGYGWTSFVRHRYCVDDAEGALFYRNIGRWLAVMRLIGGTDLHADNIIADGPAPVVIDAETLFTPAAPAAPTGCGAAVDAATVIEYRSVLRTGLLPMRASLLSGIDLSGVGNLPGQQPRMSALTIAGSGTDAAHLAMASGEIAASRNHPSPNPAPDRFWGQIVDGFREVNERLSAIDAGNGLADLLRPLIGCEVRRVPRSSRVYADLRRMLWHPASLHDEPSALQRARTVLARHASVTPGAAADEAGIDAEVDALLVGDIPVFAEPVDLATIEAAVVDWRGTDLALESRLIECAVVGAFRDGVPTGTRESAVVSAGPDGPAVVSAGSDELAVVPAGPDGPAVAPVGAGGDAGAADPYGPGERERLRRALAAAGTRDICDTAIRGADGTAAWLGPALADAGWSVRVLPPDLYSGHGGVAVCLAAYQHEVDQGRADPVDGLAETLHHTLATLYAAEDMVSPAHCGGFTGLAGQVWTWCALARLTGDAEMVDRARSRAKLLRVGAGEDLRADVLGGVAGAVVPLLGLAELTGDAGWLAVAAEAGDRLVAGARHDGRGAYWPATSFPAGTGGFAYGSAGVGWALARLAGSAAGTRSSRKRWRALADRAFGFTESLSRSAPDTWPDPGTGRPELRAGWCHGHAGVGLAAADLYARGGGSRYRDIARRAATSVARHGPGWGRTLCHGDPGGLELITMLRRVDPDGVSAEPAVDTHLLQVLGQRPRGARAAEAAAPGLLTGVAGTVLTLLRMHPDHQVCAPLLLDAGG